MDKLINDYMIVEAYNKTDLSGRVLNAISEGWQPIGGVSVVVTPSAGAGLYMGESVIFFQAVVRCEE